MIPGSKTLLKAESLNGSTRKETGKNEKRKNKNSHFHADDGNPDFGKIYGFGGCGGGVRIGS